MMAEGWVKTPLDGLFCVSHLSPVSSHTLSTQGPNAGRMPVRVAALHPQSLLPPTSWSGIPSVYVKKPKLRLVRSRVRSRIQMPVLMLSIGLCSFYYNIDF